METFEYVVEAIDGDQECGELKLTARALLPPEIMEGTHLRQEFFEYTIID